AALGSTATMICSFAMTSARMHTCPTFSSKMPGGAGALHCKSWVHWKRKCGPEAAAEFASARKPPIMSLWSATTKRVTDRTRPRPKRPWTFAPSGHCPPQEALGIAADLKLELTLRLRRRRKPLPQIGGKIERARRLDQEPEAIAAAHQGKRRLRRAKHTHGLLARRRRREPARKAFGVVLVAARDDEARPPSERRGEGSFRPPQFCPARSKWGQRRERGADA